MELYLMELVLGWPDKYLELTRTLLYPEFFNRIYCWSIELIEQEQIKPLKYMIIMRSEGKFLRHFKEAAPLAVSTFGSKIGHLTLRMILHSSSKKVGLVAHHYHHFVRAKFLLNLNHEHNFSVSELQCCEYLASVAVVLCISNY